MVRKCQVLVTHPLTGRHRSDDRVAGTTYHVLVDAFTATSVSFGIQIDGP